MTEDQISFNENQKSTLKQIQELNNELKKLPKDIEFYKALYPNFNIESQQIHDLLNQYQTQAITNILGIHHENLKIEDVFETLFEKIDIHLELIKNPNFKSKSYAPIPTIYKSNSNNGLNTDFYAGSNILRPQLKFKNKVDNSKLTPFISLVYKINYKPNAQIELDKISEPFKVALKNFLSGEPIDPILYKLPNPYEHEFLNSQIPSHGLEIKNEEELKASMPVGVENREFKWIDNEIKLVEMIQHLKLQQDISVDLEHHDFRSYYGFVCLMQISSREKDFLIDTFELRDELNRLNEVFTDPRIVKVFHGSDYDIMWLQRDFGLYVVNLFDTFQASLLLKLPKKSLAYLISNYLGVNLDKQYQLADWRIRPLTIPMAKYGQADTHYLLYIYDLMKKELGLTKIKEVFQKSNLVAKLSYMKPKMNKVDKIVAKYSIKLNTIQWKVLDALYEWRDCMAREEDESTQFIMPNLQMISLAEKLPTSSFELFQCLSGAISPFVRVMANDLSILISNVLTENKPKDVEKPHSPCSTKVLKRSIKEIELQLPDPIPILSNSSKLFKFSLDEPPIKIFAPEFLADISLFSLPSEAKILK